MTLPLPHWHWIGWSALGVAVVHAALFLAVVLHLFRHRHRTDSTLLPSEVPFTVSFRIGDASQKILEYASETHPDLLVIGRQGAGTAVGKLLYGNVAERVVRKSPAPVLVIPPR